MYVGYSAIVMGERGSLGRPSAAALAVALLGVVGLGCQIYNAIMRVKSKWLTHRFAAERLRILNFKLFAFAAAAATPKDLAALVEDAARKEISRIEQAVLSGEAALDQFSPLEEVSDGPSVAAGADLKLVSEAEEVYRTLRINVQQAHAASCIARGEARSHVPGAVGQLALLCAALICVGEMVVLAWNGVFPASSIVVAPSVAATTNFAVWSLFVVSAGVSVHEHGSARAANVDRYKEYKRAVERVSRRRKSVTGRQFVEFVWEMELVASEELKLFCRDQRHGSYFI
jgi:hypothetical protein